MSRDCLDDLLNYHLIQSGAGDNLEFRHQLIQEYYAAEALLERLPELSNEELKCNYLNYLKWTEPLALMLPFVGDKTLVQRVIKLALEVDWMLGARLAGEAIPDDLQQQTVGLVNALEIPPWLKVELLKETRSRFAIPALGQFIQDSNDWLVRSWAADALGEIGHPDAVPHLIRALQDEDSSVRRNAADALGKIGHPDTVPNLLQALQDADSGVRQNAADALGKVGIDAVPALIQALQDENFFVRLYAADALGKVGAPEAVPTLIQVLRNADFDRGGNVVEAWNNIDTREALTYEFTDSDNSVRGCAAEALGMINAPEAAPALLEALQDENFFVRVGAAGALGRIGTLEAVPALTQTLREPNFFVRSEAAQALGKISVPEAVPALIQALRDAEPFVQYYAAEALGAIGVDAVPGLIQTLRDADFFVRCHAAEALGKIGTPEAVEALIQVLKGSDNGQENAEAASSEISMLDDAVLAFTRLLCVSEVLRKSDKLRVRRESIIEILKLLWGVELGIVKASSSIDTPEIVPAFIQRLKDTNSFVQWKAAEALGRIGTPDVVPVLTQALQDAKPFLPTDRSFQDMDCFAFRDMIEAFRKIGGDVNEGLSKLIYQALNLANLKVRWEVTKALGKIDAPEVLPALIQALQDGEPFVRSTAVSSLSRIGAHDANILSVCGVNVSGLVEVYSQVLEVGDDCERRSVAEALGKLGETAAIPALIRALKDEDFLVHHNAATALGNFKNDRAAHILPDLLELISQGNQAAFRALTAIQANCKFYNYEIYKFYNYEIYQQAQAKREQGKQQADQAAQPSMTIGSVGVLNTGSVIIHGNQIGKQIKLKIWLQWLGWLLNKGNR